MNADEMELAIYSKIDALQAEIKERQAAIKELLTKLPYGYIIVRTFIKDWSSHNSSMNKGSVSYFPENIALSGWVRNKHNARIFRSMRDAQYYLNHIDNPLKDYVEIKIERVEK